MDSILNNLDSNMDNIEEIIFNEKRNFKNLETDLLKEISDIKNEINNEIDSITEKINGLKKQIKSKKKIIKNKKNIINSIENEFQRMKNRNNIFNEFNANTIKNAIYKAKYYDSFDLINHKCNDKICTTCLANDFISNKYGNWNSAGMEKWTDNFLNEHKGLIMKNNVNKLQYLTEKMTGSSIRTIKEFTETI